MKYAFIFDADIPSGDDFFCQVGFGEEVCLVAGVLVPVCLAAVCAYKPAKTVTENNAPSTPLLTGNLIEVNFLIL